MNNDHIPVPAEHAPKRRMDTTDHRIAISEVNNSDAWIACRKADTIEVRQ